MITRIEVSTPDIENTYLDIDPETKHGFLIDPGAAPDQIADAIRSGGFTIEKILLTHGHFDHIGAIDAIREAFGHPPVYIHEAGLRYLSSTFFNLSGPMGRPFTVEGAIPFQDGAVFSLQSNPAFSLRAIHVPGHSEDSTLLYSESGGYAFSGDTVFQGAVGATHFPGGGMRNLLPASGTGCSRSRQIRSFILGTGNRQCYPVKFRCCAVSRD
mgnify:CR=1 FL=1|jgi:hydroxyacylglutathione hydrolase